MKTTLFSCILAWIFLSATETACGKFPNGTPPVPQTTTPATENQEVCLSIVLTDIPDSDGQVIVGIYDKEEGAFSTTSAYQYRFRPSQKGSMRFEFRLPRGTYAAGAYHDANKNGKLDANRLGIPKEYYGLSNNVTLPNFKKASVLVEKDTEIRIKMHKF